MSPMSTEALNLYIDTSSDAVFSSSVVHLVSPVVKFSPLKSQGSRFTAVHSSTVDTILDNYLEIAAKEGKTTLEILDYLMDPSGSCSWY